MQLIEPCCAPKHLLAVRDKIGERGTAFFHGLGDLSIREFMDALLIRYCETDMILVTPVLPDVATETVRGIMRLTRARMDGKGNMNVLRHLTLITDFRESKSPVAATWITDNPFGERMTLRNVQQNDTAIILPDIAFVGNINLSYGGHFTAIATANKDVISDLRKNYMALQAKA